MRGHDVVLTALGIRQNVPTTLLRDAMASTLKAMQAAQVRRLLAVSAAMLFRGSPATWLVRTLLKHVAKDSEEMEGLMQQSALDWTIVRPPRLTDGPHTGRYRALDGRLPSFGMSISRADVAHFMLDALDAHHRVIVGVSK